MENDRSFTWCVCRVLSCLYVKRGRGFRTHGPHMMLVSSHTCITVHRAHLQLLLQVESFFYNYVRIVWDIACNRNNDKIRLQITACSFEYARNDMYSCSQQTQVNIQLLTAESNFHLRQLTFYMPYVVEDTQYGPAGLVHLMRMLLSKFIHRLSQIYRKEHSQIQGTTVLWLQYFYSFRTEYDAHGSLMKSTLEFAITKHNILLKGRPV
jgi:hypothetical protein